MTRRFLPGARNFADGPGAVILEFAKALAKALRMLLRPRLGTDAGVHCYTALSCARPGPPLLVPLYSLRRTSRPLAPAVFVSWVLRWLPLACQLFSFSYPRWAHALCDGVSVFCRILGFLHRRQVEPHVRADIVTGYAVAVGVPDSEIVLGGCIALVGCEAIPLGSLNVILRHALAIGVAGSEIVLGSCVALVGREAIPLRGLNVILRDPLAVGIQNPEIVLADRVALLGQRTTYSGGELAINFLPHRSQVTVATRTIPCELRQTLTFMYGGDANFEHGALPAHAGQVVAQAVGCFAIPSLRCCFCGRCPNVRFLLLQLIHVGVALRDEKVGN